MGVADLRARGPGPLPRRLSRALDEAARREKSLDARAAGDILACIAQHPAQERADAGDRTPQVQGLGLRRLGRFADRQFHSAAELGVVAHQGEGACAPLVHGGLGQALGDTVAVRFGGALLPNLRQMILPGGIVEMREPLRTLAPHRRPPPAPGAGRPHGGRRDGGLREPATAEEHGTLLRVDLIIFGLAAMDSLPREGVSEHAGDTFTGTQVGPPIPGKDTCDGNDDVLSIGGKRLASGRWTGLHVAVPHALAVRMQETDVQAAGMQVDATIRVMLFGVPSPEVSSSP
jgi:hypothetical protein